MLTISLSLPESIIKKIDSDKGQIGRSRYAALLLEKGIESLEHGAAETK